MPGMNTTGEPRTTDYNLGRGKLYFSELSGGLPIAWRDLGNTPELVLTIETEKLEHRSSREGLKKVDLEVVVGQKLSLRCTLDEINFENLALFFGGDASSRANAGGSPITGVENLVVTEQGRWFDLFADAGGMPAEDIQASRIYDIGEVTIESADGGTAMVEGTDFDVDHELGRIFVKSGGAMVAGTYNVDVAANATASATVHEVSVLRNSAVVGALKFVGVNPADADKVIEYNMHQVRLSAEGDLPLITDEWATLPLTGTLEENAVADPSSPMLTIVTNPNQ